jgi:hypothetical protein
VHSVIFKHCSGSSLFLCVPLSCLQHVAAALSVLLWIPVPLSPDNARFIVRFALASSVSYLHGRSLFMYF